MTNVIIRLNSAGVRELLTSPGIQADIMRRAEAVRDAAGPGHDALNTTTNRARAHVMTKTAEAARSEATGHTLTIAINAARG